MSNFAFLKDEFKSFYSDAKQVESLAMSDPRASCWRARFTLELAVHWLFEHDRALSRPYDSKLNSMIHTPSFMQLLPPHIFSKVRVIQRKGNLAAHARKPIRQHDSMDLCEELFHLLYWIARTYTRKSDPKHIEAVFDRNLIVKSHIDAKPSRDQDLKKELETIKKDRDEQDKAIQEREAMLRAQARTLEEREEKLKELDSELAQTREELAQAKSRNIKVPDTHDYNEHETRKRLINILLQDAGWTIGEDASEEYQVSGMPNKTGEGFADYVLWGEDGLPLAVVEAKRALKDPHVGQQQAKLYADCLEKMKGRRPVVFFTNGYETWLWDDTLYPPREVQGFYTKSELQLMIQRRGLRQDLPGQTVKDAIVDRHYQKRVIKSMCEEFMKSQRKGLLAMATGTGKTRTVIALVELLMRSNWVKRVLFLADRGPLVNQAVGAFKAHLPESSPVNLVHEKDGQGRVYACTYQTMINLIDKMEGDCRKYGVGHFDLVVIDEAHRSVYQKYRAIFNYFDSLLVGLTATPRDEVHHDTYHLFDLETGVPTDFYGLEEAVSDGFLVPPASVSVGLRFQREGIHYDDLSEDEKEHWEELDWGEYGEDGIPSDVNANAVNSWLFNEDTVDKVLKLLMLSGQKVDGGDTIGKTIIFAKNHKHANYIKERFDIHYPKIGNFASVISHEDSYAQSLIEDFEENNKDPRIAISVDMLDTGIDVPGVVNLVFFKIVRSKTKFLQMIGRGTRLCPDLFGPGRDKEYFAIFDFCGNLEFFNENPDGVAGSLSESLSTKLFKHRLELLEHLDNPDTEPLVKMTEGIRDILFNEVAAMNPDNFIVRSKRKYVDRFKTRDAWNSLDSEKINTLASHVAGLPAELEREDITAKLFDLTCLKLQIALVEQSASFEGLKHKVQDIAMDLEEKESIPMVKASMALIQSLLTDEYWEDITLPMLESLRRKLRDLVKFTDRKKKEPVYTMLEDDYGCVEEVPITMFDTGINLVQYRKKVEEHIRANENHITIHKLKHNKPLTPSDLSELERFMFESGEVQSREVFENAFGKQEQLTVFIRSIVGLDRGAAKAVFSKFLDTGRFNTSQIRFIEMIIDHLTQKGVMDPGLLYEQPYTGIHYEGLDGVFPSASADEIVNIIGTINDNAQVRAAEG